MCLLLCGYLWLRGQAKRVTISLLLFWVDFVIIWQRQIVCRWTLWAFNQIRFWFSCLLLSWDFTRFQWRYLAFSVIVVHPWLSEGNSSIFRLSFCSVASTCQHILSIVLITFRLSAPLSIPGRATPSLFDLSQPISTASPSRLFIHRKFSQFFPWPTWYSL